MRLLTGSGTPRRWADANIAIIGLYYPIDDQTAALFGCLVIIDGQNPATVPWRHRITQLLTAHLRNALLK